MLDETPVIMDKRTVIDAERLNAHLIFTHYLAKARLDTSKQTACGMSYLRGAIDRGWAAGAHVPECDWLFNPDCIVLDPYDDFRRSLGMGECYPNKPPSKVALAVAGVLYGARP